VSAAIKRLGYTPNIAARMLMGRESNAIGVIVPSLADPFFAEAAHSIQESARLRNTLVWVASSNSDHATERSLVQKMIQHGVDGIVLTPSPGPESLGLNPNHPPIVMFDCRPPDGDWDAVLVDNRFASRKAVAHLIAHGYTEIDCISVDSEDVYTTHERMEGYRDAMRAAGLPIRVWASCQSLKDARKIIQVRSAETPRLRAIFTTNNVTTLKILATLRSLNLRIPGDVALIGFDDFDFGALLQPSLTLIRQPVNALGKRVAGLLFDRIGSDDEVKCETVTLPATLITRESCGCSLLEWLPPDL
jgi:LacI family transcriptional regulator